MSTPELRYFLVVGEVEVSHYMSDKKSRERETRLVRATDEAEAQAKFTLHFEHQTQDYATYYSVRDVEVLPTLE